MIIGSFAQVTTNTLHGKMQKKLWSEITWGPGMAIQNKYTIKGASIILCTFSNPNSVKISVGGWLKLALGKFGPLVTMVRETIKNHTQYMKHFFGTWYFCA